MSCVLRIYPNELPLALNHDRNTFDTYAIPMTIKECSRQSLGEGICQVFHKSNVLHNHISSHYYLMYQVILLLYVFTILVVSWFFRLWYHSNVIIKQYQRWYNLGHYPKSYEKLSKPIKQIPFIIVEATTYLASIVESTIQDCFTLLQLTTS